MKKIENGQSGVEKTAKLPRSIANCFADIEKGRAGLNALREALECHINGWACEKGGLQHDIYREFGDLERAVLNDTIAGLSRFRHAIRTIEAVLYSLGERRSPSSPAERGEKWFNECFCKFASAARAAIQIVDEIEEAGYDDEQAEQNPFIELKPEDLKAVREETIDKAASNLHDLAAKVKAAQVVIGNLQQERL